MVSLLSGSVGTGYIVAPVQASTGVAGLLNGEGGSALLGPDRRAALDVVSVYAGSDNAGADDAVPADLDASEQFSALADNCDASVDDFRALLIDRPIAPKSQVAALADRHLFVENSLLHDRAGLDVGAVEDDRVADGGALLDVNAG